ncbi:MAG: ABC transporter ATP-binding protein [Methanomicrobiales archaeon]
MIEIRGLTYRYPGGGVDVLRGIDLAISPGECVVVTGPTGAGKTTLCMAAAGITVHELGGEQTGSVTINGTDVREYDSMTGLGRQVGMVFDDPDSQLIFTTVEEEITSALDHRGLTRDELEDRLEEILEATRISELRHRAPHTLSGGQKQRVAIAATLALGTPALILDEPTSELDDEATEIILSILTALKAQGGAILCVEHKLTRTAGLADRCYRLSDGVLSPLAVEIDDDGIYRVDLPSPPPEAPGEPLISTRNLVHRYGDIPALNGIDLEIGRGECVAVVGKNGSGKTTLIKHFNGLLRPTSGSVSVSGQDTAREGPSRMARRVGLVFQNPDTMLFAETVTEEVAFGVDNLGLPDRDGAVSSALARVGLTGARELYPRALSRGERQRLAIASVLAMDTDVLVLDEPTTGLDPVEAGKIMEILRDLQRAGRTIVMVTHCMDLVAASADRVIRMEEGRVIEDTGGMVHA